MSETMNVHEAILVATNLANEGRLAESQGAFVALLGSQVRPAALLGLALLSTRNGDTEIARALLEQSLGADRHNPAALYELALVHARSGEREQAIALFGETLVHDPSHYGALNQLAALARGASPRPDGDATPRPTPSVGRGMSSGPQTPSGVPAAQPPDTPPPSAAQNPSALVGIAQNVNRGVGPYRGRPAALQIWTLRVQTYDGAGSPTELFGVEMRGTEIRGTLEEGDWVEIAERPKPGEGCRPKQLRNLTTNDLVVSRMHIFT